MVFSVELSPQENAPFLPPSDAPPSPGSGNSPPSPTGHECDDSDPVSQSPYHVKRRLYASHFLSTWNSRVFEFGAVLFLAHMFPNTLLPPSLYALLRAASAMCFSPMVGGYIDSRNRLIVLRISIIGQRTAVMLSCLLFWAMSVSTDLNMVRYILLGVLCPLACIEKICSVMNLIAIERDWVVTIAEEAQTGLESLNSQMRRMDLFCKLVGPLLIALVDGASSMLAIWTTLGMSAASLPLEYCAIAKVYRAVAGLRVPRTGRPDSSGNGELSAMARFLSTIAGTFKDVSAYIHHGVFLSSLALSLLYLTVLSFSGQMITYLLSAGYTSTHIGFMRAFSVLFELSATWVVPFATNRVGHLRTGLWSINWQVLCVVVATVLFLFLDTPFIGALPLVAGVALSRIGLWGFDLSVQTIVQEGVESENRGSFSSVEASVQNFFELLAYASTAIFARPPLFRYPVMMSAGATLAAGILYAKFVRDHRGHLLHVSQCMSGKHKSTSGQGGRAAVIGLRDIP